ncbi:hypothetical protein RHMOL_Rhmol04G0191100 [Rhododendron molle]|uniref:Uncharacterized protein n=1 Tax=Rhododendron molle TaxID=49168 RepID=A0ACC0P2H8_RHOML|nr:hypothetical protein RHMOL_Rhmol04G0191100 [Rhododendron molle]
MTTRELESTKMEVNESFVDFVKRWRAKADLMTERPSERDQLCVISRNLHPDYAKHLVLVQASTNFETFFESGLAIENALQTGVLPRGEFSSSNLQKSKPRAYFGNSSALFGGSNYVNAATSGDNAAASPDHTANINQVQNPQSFRARTQPRSFSIFEAPVSIVMEKLIKSRHLKPLAPTFPPKPLLCLPPNPCWLQSYLLVTILLVGYNPNLFCAFYQIPGHPTDKCYHL